jgi:hypothetical protein
MQEQFLDALDAATHLGWRHEHSADDADHLLIRADFSPQAAGTLEPLLRFNNDPPANPEPEASANAPADAPVADAPIDAPPYLWGGEALAPEPPVVFGSAHAQETVFS